MIPHFDILEHNAPHPDAQKIIFCDGTGGALFQSETDIELSHWRPNHTPAEYDSKNLRRHGEHRR